MRFVDVIAKKRDGHALSADDINLFVEGVTSGAVPNYQASALLMAIVLRGMTDDETGWLTAAMARSGERIDLSDLPGIKVGKHSTGGVGDKVSIALAPLAAACGVIVPKMSGRGLGHTGGTLDKLESIPGFRVSLSIDEFKRVLRDVGTCIIGQTASLAPADKRIYALRDVTGTVESIPLLASSIMSKKLAEGANALVLVVKCGDGAFMKDAAGARALAEAMQAIGTRAGVRTEAVITDMDSPLGVAVGNALEIVECIQVLKGEGPADVLGVMTRLATRMLILAEVEHEDAAAAAHVASVLQSGKALETFVKMVERQGGDPRIVDDPSRLPISESVELVRASRAGIVQRMRSSDIGRASNVLGAGRSRVDASIDHGVGLRLLAKPGDRVERDQPLIELRHRGRRGVDDAAAICQEAIVIGDTPTAPRPLVLAEIR